MARDIWLDDESPGCLECGSMVFRASRVSGVCSQCVNEAASSIPQEDFYSFGGSSDGDDIPWTENY